MYVCPSCVYTLSYFHLLNYTHNYTCLMMTSCVWNMVSHMVSDQTLILIVSSRICSYLLMQVCRNINQVKICMETGRTVILLNLESIYESLYDLLNQVMYILFDYSSGVNNQPFSFIVLCSCWKNKICRPGIAEPQSQMPSARWLQVSKHLVASWCKCACMLSYFLESQ